MLSDKLNYLIDIIFPPHCIFCNEVTYPNEVCCESCLPSVSQREPIIKLYSGEFAFSYFFAPFYYELGADNAVRRLKFKLEADNAKGLARYMAKTLSLLKSVQFDYIIAVPSYKDDSEQEFDHADLIARSLSKLTDIPLVENTLIKVKKTSKQHNISASERRYNLLNAFKVTTNQTIIGRRVLLVDDVFTTGSTMQECSKTLLEAGVYEVGAIVGAKTRFNDKNICGNHT